MAATRRAGVGPGSSLRSIHSAPEPAKWYLWLPALVGPPRKRTKTIAGVKYTAKTRRPELPPSPNDRMNYHTKAKIVKAWRAAACEAAKAAGIPPQLRIRVGAVMRRERTGQGDNDNDIGRLKPAIDGVVDAKVVKRDTYQFVEIGTVTEERGAPGVLLIVEGIA